MEKKAEVGKMMRFMGMALLLIPLLLFTKEALSQPKPEGTLKVALAGFGEEGFLPDIGDLEQGRAWSLVYEFLFYPNVKTGEPIPGLAKRFEYSKDYLTLTLYLREGVPWQDREKWGDLTAEDVKYTFERAVRDTSTSNIKEDLKATVKSMEVKNRYTLALHLKKPAPELWMALSVTHVGAPILCKKYIEAVGEEKARWAPIGSGPYRLVERKAGQYAKFEAVEKHWRAVPEFKYLILLVTPEESSRMAMLKTGEVDITPISPQQLGGLKNVKEVKAVPWPGGYSLAYAFGGMITPKDERYKAGYHWTDPWKDKRVREALNIAIDRQAIINSIYKGTAEAISVPWILKGWEKVPPIPYDPKKAKQLLVEAGYPKGFNVKVFAVSGNAPAFEIPEVSEIIAAYFTAIGLKTEIVPMDKPTENNICRAAKTVGTIFPDRTSFRPSYTGRFYQIFAPKAQNIYYQSDEAMALVDKYESALDPVKRAAALAAIRDYLYDEIITIPLVRASPLWAYRADRVGEWPPSGVDKLANLEYVRHVKPLNTWRLFTPGK